MKQTEKAATFQITLVDVVFGILLGALFTNYEKATGFTGYYLFFFTAALMINYWYTYRLWCDTVAKANERTLLADVVADMFLLFVGYQMALTFFHSDLRPYFTWFVLAFVGDLVWLAERIVVHRRRATFDIRHVYWLLSDGVVSVLLCVTYVLLRSASFPHPAVIVTVTVAFAVTFVCDPYLSKMIARKRGANKRIERDSGKAAEDGGPTGAVHP